MQIDMFHCYSVRSLDLWDAQKVIRQCQFNGVPQLCNSGGVFFSSFAKSLVAWYQQVAEDIKQEVAVVQVHRMQHVGTAAEPICPSSLGKFEEIQCLQTGGDLLTQKSVYLVKMAK